MIFLGLERPVDYGRQLIFDPTMAKMVLDAQDSYFNAVYNDYQQGVQDMKEFNKNYGDFLTLITKDQDWWNKNVTDKVHGFIADAYSRGIDLLRTPEGRAAVTLIINSMPYGEMAKKRVRAENAKEYYKAAGALAAQNKYDKDFAMFLGEDPNQWADDYMGITAPTLFLTLKEATNDWYNNRTPRDLTPKEIREMGLDSRFQHTGFLDSDLMNIARNQTPGWQGSPQARYYRELAKRQVEARGEEPTQDKIEAQLQRNIADAQQEWLVSPVRGDANPFILEDYKTAREIAAHEAKAKIDYKYKHLDDGNGDGDVTNSGYNIPEDVYVTSLAKGAGIEYLPLGGVDVNQLGDMVKQATKRQNAAIKDSGNVLTATGMFIATDKVNGLIPSEGKNGRGYFLNPNYFKDLHELDDIRSSYKGWLRKGETTERSKEIRAGNKNLSKDVIQGIKTWNTKSNKSGEYRLKVVPVIDDNNNNVYGMVGEDNKWHTYALVRVYMSNGKIPTSAGNKREIRDENGNKKKVSDIPESGRLMALEIGLHSNEGKGSPDLSITARENLGFYGYDATKKKIGMTGNSGWPYGTNTINKTIQVPFVGQ